MKLSVEQLSYHYPGINRTIFQNVSFDIEKGNLVSILGPNGAGKSTLLNCMAGLFMPDKGKVCIDGISLKELGVRKTAQRIGYVPQNHYPVYDFTVLEFVVMGRTPYIGALSSPCSKDYEKAEEALALVGAEHLSGKLYTRISGGERQLAMIARAITQEPDFIFLDEPTAHLDFGNQMKVVRMIQGLAEQGYGVVMTTHNPDHVLYTGGMAALLQRDGSLLFGDSRTIMKQETLTALYREPVYVFYLQMMGRDICLTGSMHENQENNRTGDCSRSMDYYLIFQIKILSNFFSKTSPAVTASSTLRK